MTAAIQAFGVVPTGAPVVVIDGSLTLEQVARVARRGDPVVLSNEAADAIEASASLLEHLAAQGERIYGLTTGVGALEVVELSREQNRAQQRSLLRSHAAGVGAPMSDDRVRAMLLTRVNILSRGLSGVRLEAVCALIDLLNRHVIPVVPERGSVGASDLAPLAHAALVLMGEGRAKVDGDVLAARAALDRVGLSPCELAGRDAFAIINGLNQTVGIGALALVDAKRLVALSEQAAALTIVATGAPRDFLDPLLAREKGHEGQRESARLMRELIGAGPRGPLLRTQLSMRYAPHVTGASRSAIEFCERVVATEINAGVDNPIFFAGGRSISNSGATSGQELAQALDLLATSMTSLAVISERRTAALLDPETNGGLPGFLRGPSSDSSGLMIAQYTAASLVAELRTRSVPAAIQSIPTCANREDHVSMSALAARHAAGVIETCEIVVAIELLAACRAIDLSGEPLPARLVSLHRAVREAVPHSDVDRVVGEDIEAIVSLLREDRLPE
jgi:histidine ammonia-lyase